MALIKCPECGREISDRAPACIHCGCPLSAPKSAPAGSKKVSFDDLFGNDSPVQFSKEKYLRVDFHAVLSGADTDRSRQSVFVNELGKTVAFTVPNTVQVGQHVRVQVQGETFSCIHFVVNSVTRKPEVRQAAPAHPTSGQKAAANPTSGQEAIALLKNYKPNALVRFFKSGFIGKLIGMTVTFIAVGRFGDVDPDGLVIFGGIGILLLFLCGFIPLANIKSYCKKHHIDEAIRRDTGYMNVAINAFNAYPARKMLAYIKKLNPAAAQVIERQLAEKKKK